MVPATVVYVPPDVVALCHITDPTFPDSVIVGAGLFAQIVAVPVAVPATVARSTFTVAVKVAEGQTPFVTTAL